MINLTRLQRKALHAVYLRSDGSSHPAIFPLKPHQTYRQFRRLVQPGPGCIMVPYCNMWLGIEPDGYTHS